MGLQVSELYEFGRYRLDKQRARLWRDGHPVPLTTKALEMLVVLVDHEGELVTKQHLMAKLWPDSFVEEGNLAQHVFHLRKALGETAEDSKYIVTIPGKGYRFVGDVRKIAINGTSPEDRTAAGSPNPVVVPIRATEKRFAHAGARELRIARRSWGYAIYGLVLIVAVGVYAGWRFQHRTHPENRRIMLAVLPFDNLTGDPAQDYFSDGLTEEMTSQLGRLDRQRLGVVATTLVMRHGASDQESERAIRESGVDYVLKGSVRRDAKTVRIVAHLIQTKDHTDLWVRQYDRELTSLLLLQGEIAQEIADEIQLTLGNNPKRMAGSSAPASSPSSYEAYDLYLKGRFFWNKRTRQGFEQAIECFQQATAREPGYALAYAGLADAYAMMSSYSFAPQNDLMPKARQAALTALRLDGSLAEAHTSLALIAENYDWDWQTAEREYRRAIQLNPEYATAHHWYAEYLSFQGRFEEALAESERARQLDPLSLIIATDHGAILYFSRNYDAAVQKFRSVLEMEPNFPRAHLVIFAYLQEGRFPEALADLEQWRRTNDNPWTHAVEAYVYGRAGEVAKARSALTKLEQEHPPGMDPTAMLALAYVGVNDRDAALAMLQKAFDEHSNTLTALKVDPIYDPLRDDARFQVLLREVHLEQ